MTGLAVLTPSRGRPGRLQEMLDAIQQTAWGPVDVYVGLDDDDAHHYTFDGQLDTRVIVRPRQRLAAWTNELASIALHDGAETLAFFGDDHRPRTHGWDERVGLAFDRMGSGLVYCADGLQNERLPTAPFWSADVIQALGWFYPPVLMHLYADDYWKLLADDLGRRCYLPDVLVEHMHPSATDHNGQPKAEADQLNAENDSFYDRDREAFVAFARDEHPGILHRVREALAI